MHSDSDTIEVLIYEKPDEVIQSLLSHCFLDIILSWIIQWNAVILSLMVLIYCITNVMEKFGSL